MKIVVKKYGGTSVASVSKIQQIAKQLSFDIHKGESIVVVVSAMGKTTDELFNLAYSITSQPNQREMDMLLTAGERITMALLSLSLEKLNIQSISFTGSQSGIITDNSHGNAKILRVNAFRILEELKKNKIVIVAGFQGVSTDKEITTLGRGGSDTTAVALGCFLKAIKCEIFTDVDGVYQIDPNKYSQGKIIEHLSYEEMMYLSYTGAKILHYRAAEFAYKYRVPIEIKNSNVNTCDAVPNQLSTYIGDAMEKSEVNAISYKENILIFRVKTAFIPKFNTELIDFQFSSKSNCLELYIENNNKENLSSELIKNDLTFSIDENEYIIINLLGFRIHKDISFLNVLQDLLSKSCKEPFTIYNQGIGVQIVTYHSESNNVIQTIINNIMEVT